MKDDIHKQKMQIKSAIRRVTQPKDTGFWMLNNKYTPHQGKQEIARRAARNSS